MSDFQFRDATPEDRKEVLSLAAAASQSGDYIHWVFEDWVSDQAGRFLLAVESASGRIAAMDKLSLLSPTEAWFEGLRVHPDFRGRGLATRMERYMIEEAGRLGATVIRFLTRLDNYPVHRNAYRHGFSMRFVVRHYEWSGGPSAPPSAQLTDGERLRPATCDEAPALYHWWERTASFWATAGLVNRQWSFSATSAAEWEERAERGELLVAPSYDEAEAVLPPSLALFSKVEYAESGPEWIISLASASGDEWGQLAASLIGEARARDIKVVGGVLPDSMQIHEAFTRAGFAADDEYGLLSLFERTSS